MVSRIKLPYAAWPWGIMIVCLVTGLALAAHGRGSKRHALDHRAAQISCGTSRKTVHRLLGLPTGTLPTGDRLTEYWIGDGERIDVEYGDDHVSGAWGSDKTSQRGSYGMVYPGCILPNPMD